jgi:hydrogenase maturation protease
MSTIDQPRVLVLGYGNPGRQDDGLGPAVASRIEALGWPNVTAYDNYQLTIEDAVEVAAHDIVWFVDASKAGSSPYGVEALSASTGLEFTSHLVRPEAILALASRYYDARPIAYLLGVRGYEFGFVESFTPAAVDNLELAIDMLTASLRAVQKSATG